MTRTLTVLLAGRRAGTLTQDDAGTLTLRYESAYRKLHDALAKNYSMMLTPGQVRLAALYDVASSLRTRTCIRPVCGSP